MLFEGRPAIINVLLALPPLVQQAQEFLIKIYGPKNPDRMWFILMTICAFMLFFRNYRRIGGIGLFSLFLMMHMWNWLQIMYKQFTPSDPAGP